MRRTTRGALPVEHLGWDARVIDLSGQRVAQEIASLLGETTAETKVALLKLKKTLQEEEEKK